MKRLLRWTGFAAGCTLIAALGAPAAAPAAGEAPYEIHAIISQTGPAALAGGPITKGLQVIEDYVNASGGIKGRPIKIVVADDQTNPQVAVQLANVLIAQKVPAIVGPMTTASCNAVAPLAASGPVSYCVSPFTDAPAGGFVFAGGPTAADAAAVVLRFFRERGMTRFAMLDDTDASGQMLDKAFDQAFALPENKTLSVVAHQHFAPTDPTVSAQIANIKAANPQVLISWMVGTPFATVLRGAHDAGLDIPIVTNGANMSKRFMAQLATALPSEVDFAAYPSYPQGAPGVSQRIVDQQTIEDQAFKTAGIPTDPTATGVWDLTLLLVDALRHLPADPSAEAVRAYIANLHDWPGTNAIYDFRQYPQRGAGRNGQIVGRYNAATNDFIPVSKPGGAIK